MPTILIVEDNEDIRLNLVEYLESKNYQTDNTDDGLKALALTIVNKYDLIVLDIMIPGMDGLRLCRELRSRGNTTPIIILSAKDSTDDRIMGISRRYGAQAQSDSFPDSCLFDAEKSRSCFS